MCIRDRHSNLNDSAFNKLPFDRVARTDSRGRFSIRGVAPGKYRIFGLMDSDQNFAFTQKSEVIAFNDSLIIPRMEAVSYTHLYRLQLCVRLHGW